MNRRGQIHRLLIEHEGKDNRQDQEVSRVVEEWRNLIIKKMNDGDAITGFQNMVVVQALEVIKHMNLRPSTQIK